MPEIREPCPICAQELNAEACRNNLCTGKAGPLFLDGIEAITLYQDPLNRVVRRYKYEDKTGWALIFARLLMGYLNQYWSPNRVDLIIANPSGPKRDHTTRVIHEAAQTDLDHLWPFDLPPDLTITKTAETTKSAGQDFAGKEKAAKEHAQALQLHHPNRIRGKRVVVYDDICTTGLQLNCVAGRLRKWGATSVTGIVLARQPWS